MLSVGCRKPQSSNFKSQVVDRGSSLDKDVLKLYYTIHRPQKLDVGFPPRSQTKQSPLVQFLRDDRPQTPFYVSRDSPLTRTSSQNLVKYVYLSQNKPQPLHPLKAWKGYNGNLYFEPIRISRYNNGVTETSERLMTSHTTTENRKSNKKTRKPREVTSLSQKTLTLSEECETLHITNWSRRNRPVRSCGGQSFSKNFLRRGSMAHQVAQRISQTETAEAEPEISVKREVSSLSQKTRQSPTKSGGKGQSLVNSSFTHNNSEESLTINQLISSVNSLP